MQNLKKICGPSPKESRDRFFSKIFCTWFSIQNTSKKSVWQNFPKIFYLTGIILFIMFERPFSKYILAIDVIWGPILQQSVIFESSLSQPFLGSGLFSHLQSIAKWKRKKFADPGIVTIVTKCVKIRHQLTLNSEISPIVFPWLIKWVF